jgi:hypothetical protein
VLTIASAPEGIPIILGMLRIHRRCRVKGRPGLEIVAHCQACGSVHSSKVDDPTRLEAVHVVPSQCGRGPWVGSQVAIAADPARSENRAVLRDFAAALRRFNIERDLAGFQTQTARRR